MTTGFDRPLAFAVAHINASARHRIDAASLLAACGRTWCPPEHEHRVRDFLYETEVETLSDLVRGGAVTYDALARLAARYLPATHETRTWLDERA
jgi:hypothetical protein